MKLINFMAAVERLGRTNRERAAQLDMTGRRLEQWNRFGPPRLLRVLAAHPELVEALLVDAQEAAKETSLAS